MKRFLMVAWLMGMGISALAESTPEMRDPFWPIDYDTAKAATRDSQSPSESTEPAPVVSKPEAPPLTENELRQLALDESERIRQTLRREHYYSGRTGRTGERKPK